MLEVKLDEQAIGPLLLAAARRAVAEFSTEQQKLPDRAMNEAEAAEWLGIEEHVLADERRRGRITASKIVGRRIRYLRGDLVDYLVERRVARVSAERN